MLIELTVVGVRNYCPDGEAGLPAFFDRLPIGTTLYLRVNATGEPFPGAISVYDENMQKIGTVSKTERRFIKRMIPAGGLYPVVISQHSLENHAIYIKGETNLEFETPYLRAIPLEDGEMRLPTAPEDERASLLADMLRTQINRLILATPEIRKEEADASQLAALTLNESFTFPLPGDAPSLLNNVKSLLKEYAPLCAESLDGPSAFARGEILLFVRLLCPVYPELKKYYQQILDDHKDLNRDSGDVRVAKYRKQSQRIRNMAYTPNERTQRSPMQEFLNALQQVHGEPLSIDAIQEEIAKLKQLLGSSLFGHYFECVNDDLAFSHKLYSLNYQLPALYTLMWRRLRLEFLESLLANGIEKADQIVTNPDEVAASSYPDDLPPLCVAIPRKQHLLLRKAVQEEIIVYNADRQGYDVAESSSQVLVAYLVGRVFFKDHSKDGCWEKGKRFADAQIYADLFGFDVANTRRSATGKSTKVPIGASRVDKIFE